jgi:hypothetical protein
MRAGATGALNYTDKTEKEEPDDNRNFERLMKPNT